MTYAPRRATPKPWFVIDPIYDRKSVSMSFENPTSRPVAYSIHGVRPSPLFVELDGNTSWSTNLTMDDSAVEVSITDRKTGEIVAIGRPIVLEV